MSDMHFDRRVNGSPGDPPTADGLLCISYSVKEIRTWDVRREFLLPFSAPLALLGNF
jgi:hypothetical protein